MSSKRKQKTTFECPFCKKKIKSTASWVDHFCLEHVDTLPKIINDEWNPSARDGRSREITDKELDRLRRFLGRRRILQTDCGF